jgi:hypothetical protein
MKKPAKNKAQEIRALKGMKDSQIDLTDVPEIRDWSKAVVRQVLPADQKIAHNSCGRRRLGVAQGKRKEDTKPVSTRFYVRQWMIAPGIRH